jgi:hypothetical protein
MCAYVSSRQLQVVWLVSGCVVAARAGSKAFGVVSSCAGAVWAGCSRIYLGWWARQNLMQVCLEPDELPSKFATRRMRRIW